MPTYTALTTVAGSDAAERLGAALEALDPAPTGLGVFEMEDGSGLWEVGGYFDAPPDGAALALLAAAFGARDFAVSELPETDWVAKVRRDLRPVEAGRFFVHGSHDAGAIPPGRVALLIEASMAFGTGHHGTTQGCLLAIERLAAAGAEPKRILDLGCGTAVLAMAAAHAWPGAEVVASDIDPVAVEVARANLEANGLSSRIPCVEAAGLDHARIAGLAPFDLVLANILKAPLLALAPGLATVIAPAGTAILSGILCDQAPEVVRGYSACGFNETDRIEIVDWVTLSLARKARKT